MLIFSFLEIFMHDSFQSTFPDTPLSRIRVCEWIAESTLPAARRIISRLTQKIEAKAKNSPIQDTETRTPTKFNLLEEFNERQVQQTYQAAYSLSLFCVRDVRVYQAFRHTFGVRLQKISVLNAGSFVQGINTRAPAPGTTNLRTRPLQLSRKPTVFDVLLWFHSVNMVLDEQRAKKLSCGARINYTTGNIIGFVVSKITDAWNTLLRVLGHTSLSQAIASYLVSVRR